MNIVHIQRFEVSTFSHQLALSTTSFFFLFICNEEFPHHRLNLAMSFIPFLSFFFGLFRRMYLTEVLDTLIRALTLTGEGIEVRMRCLLLHTRKVWLEDTG